MAESIIIYDTTLRDGTQAENFNISLEDKIKICRELDSFGIDYIGSVKRRPSARVRYPSALRTASWLMPRRALRHTRAAGVSTREATTARARAAGAPGATVGLAPSTGAAER